MTTYDDFDSANPSSMQGGCHIWTQLKCPCSPWVLVAQWIELPPGVRKVMGSIPVGDSDFSMLESCRWTHRSHEVSLFPGQLTLFHSPPTWFQYTVGPRGLKMGHLGHFGILCIFLHQTWHMNLRCVPDSFDIKTDTKSWMMTSQIMTSQIMTSPISVI